MLDSINHMTLKFTKRAHFWHENAKILSSFTHRYNGCHYVTLHYLSTMSGLSILLHDVISLPGAESCDNV